MRKMMDRLHARMGDFWWYSLMLFCACRAADACRQAQLAATAQQERVLLPW